MDRNADFSLLSLRYLPGWTAVVVMLIFSAWLVLPLNPDPEVAWMLHATALWLEGGKLYTTIATPLAPPLFLLSSIPVLLARLVDSDPDLFYTCFVYLLSVVSLVLTMMILRRGEIFLLRFGSNFLITALAFVVLLAPLITGNAMFRREHLAIIFMLPYIMAALPSVAVQPPRLHTFAAGMMAAFGIMLSPGFLLLWLAVEASYVIRERRFTLLRHPLNRTTVIGLAGWLIVNGVFFPDYFTSIMPLYFSSSQFSLLVPEAEWTVGKAILLPLAMGCLFFVLKPAGQWRSDVFTAVLLFTAAALLGILTPEAPDVRFYPALATALLAICLLFLNFAYTEGRGRDAFREGGGLAFSLGAMVVMTYNFAQSYWHHSSADEQQYMYWELADNIDAYAFDKEVFVFADSYWPAFPLVNNTGGQWHSRYSHLWLLEAIYVPGKLELQTGHTVRFHGNKDWEWLEIALFDALWLDFTANRPFLMIFDESPANYAGQYFLDYRAYFAQDPRFNELFALFKRVHTIDMCEEFHLTQHCRYGLYHHGGLYD